ncbi:hypothetical protein V8E55_000542 [Tylopilus felleus]
MVKLKKGPTMHGALQNAIVAVINDPNYSFSLPKLSDWESIVSSSADEKQRLEFVGDAVMHLSVALYLYRLFPNAAPGLYTNIRSAVNANATFTHLMVKAGAYKLPSQSHTTKAAADSFEVIVAALYLERGFADVCAWVQEQYAPLIAAARESYDKCLAKSDRNISFLSTKRHRGSVDPASTPLLKKIRLSSGRSSPRSTLMAQRVINRMKSKGKVKLCLPTKKSTLPFEMRLHSCERRTPEPEQPSSLVIDLTLDSESADEETAPSNATQVSQHSFRPSNPSQQYRPMLRCDTPPADQNPDKCTVFYWPSQQSSTSSMTLSHPSPELPSPAARSPTATPSRRFTSIASQATFEFFRRSGLSLPPRSASMHISVGSYENPIVIEDSDTEN